MAIALLLSVTVASAQMKNSKTENVKIFGNCGMCKSKIEKAGTQKDISVVDWNKDTKMATLSFDSKKTTSKEILERIAVAGYDSEEIHAEKEAYSKLPKCCQYDRATDVKKNTIKE